MEKTMSLLLVIGLIAGAATAQAQPLPTTQHTLAPSQWTLSFPWSGGQIIAMEGPTHGALVAGPNSNELTYNLYSSTDFRSIGVDSAILTIDDGGTLVHHRLVFLAGVQAFQTGAYDFEAGETPPLEFDPEGQLDIVPEGALFGQAGARLVLDGSGEDAYFEIGIPTFVPEPGSNNRDVPDTGCADLRIGLGGGGGRTPEMVCQDVDGSVVLCTASLMSGWGADGLEVFRIEAKFSNSSTALRTIAFNEVDQATASPWIDIDAEAHSIRLDWWTDQTAGIRLWLDGIAVAELKDTGTAAPVETVQIGASGVPTGLVLDYAIDAFRIYGGLSGSPRDALVQDSFEGDLSTWTATGSGSGGSVATSPSAALAGNSGLAIDLGTGWGDWLLQTTPQAKRSAGLGFLIDADQLDLKEDQTLALVYGMQADTSVPGNRFGLRIWNSPAGIRIQANGQDDDFNIFRTHYTAPITGTHRVDLRWQAAREPGSRDGWMRFWLDGSLVGEVLHLDNAVFDFEAIRVGALGIPADAGGTLHLDEIDLWSMVLP